MKIIKIIASFLLILGISALAIWAGFKTKKQTCTGVSIVIHAGKDSELLTKSDVLNILEQNNIEWEGKMIEEINLPSIKEFLTKASYIKSVDNIHFSGTKLQIEVSLHDILLKVAPNNGEEFLLDVNGITLPYSPNAGSDVIVAKGFIPPKNEKVSIENSEHSELLYLASLIKQDPFYEDLFHEIEVNNKHEFILHPSVGKIPVLFGTTQDAEDKLKTLKYIYKEILPYVSEDKYKQLDVRFQNRIIATKTKS